MRRLRDLLTDYEADEAADGRDGVAKPATITRKLRREIAQLRLETRTSLSIFQPLSTADEQHYRQHCP